MVRLALVGLGKMGLSHLSIVRAHPQVNLVGVCDPSKFMLELLGKNADLETFTDFKTMIERARPEAIIVATPSRFHGEIARVALERGIHVFCEKPFCLDWKESMELSELAERKALVNQVGYHYRFVAAFQEVKRLLEANAIGTVTHVLAEAYGPVVLRPSGSSWRTQKSEGGGCLYDYAAHPINLLNWYFGMPTRVGGTAINKIFSRDTDDEVYGTVFFEDGPSAQISVNWSDESYRKMSVKLSIWGTAGRIFADRQECKVYLRDDAHSAPGYSKGWNVRYTTDLTEAVWFYVRGEEYSLQVDYFVKAVASGSTGNVNSFAAAAQTDQLMSMMRDDAQGVLPVPLASPAIQQKKRALFRWLEEGGANGSDAKFAFWR
jgi:predicted dehydrogenase